MPRVSVIIPTYQCANFIARAIDSVLSQTYQDFEIIVIDDGSTDNTAEILRGYQGHLRIITQINQGPAVARNAGILQSLGAYIAFLDADDVWLPEKLAYQIELMERDDTVGLVFSDMYLLRSDQTLSMNYFSLVQPVSGKVFSDLFLSNFIPTSTVVLRRSCLDMSNLFGSQFTPCEDYDLWLRIAKIWHINFVNRPLAYYDLRQGSLSKNLLRMFQSLLAVKESAMAYAPELASLPKRQLDKGYYLSYLRTGRLFLSFHDRVNARCMIEKYKEKRYASLRYQILMGLTYLPTPILEVCLFVWNLFFPVDDLTKKLLH